MSKLNKETLEIKQHLDADAQVMLGLKATYTKAIQTEKLLLDTRKNIFEKNNKLTMLQGVGKSTRLNSLLTDINQGYASIAAAHSKYINQVESNVLKPLTDFPVRAKDLKATIIAYDAKKKVFDKEKINASRALKNAGALTKAENEFGTKQSEVFVGIQDYQREKIGNLKQILLDSMNAEMYYHAQALERISDLAHKVYNLDSTREAEEILKDYITIVPQGQGQPQAQGSQARPPLSQAQSQAQPQPQSSSLAQSQSKPNLQASALPQASTQLQGSESQNKLPPAQNQSQNIAQSQAQPSVAQSQSQSQQSSAQPQVAQTK